MRIPLVRGRFFTNQDDDRSSRVVVIDEVFARRHFPNTDPLGRRINYGDGALEIVGVVGHVKQWSLGADDKQTLQAQLYEPMRQTNGMPPGVDVVMRAESTAPALWDAIHRVVADQNSQNVIFKAQTMTDVMADFGAQRVLTIVLDAFAATALLLASVGTAASFHISWVSGPRAEPSSSRSVRSGRMWFDWC